MSPGRSESLQWECFHYGEGWLLMTKVLAGITTSVDGYVTGPDDGPGKGLGEGGERLHYWVFGARGRTRASREASRRARTPPGWRR